VNKQPPPPDAWRAPPEAAGLRLDRYLAEHYSVPRNRTRTWILAGEVTVDGRPGKPGLKLHGGEEIHCRPLPTVDESRIDPEPGDLIILHEDEHLIVIDKPAGLVIHPGAGRSSGTLVHRLVAHYPEIAAVGGSGRPGIVHRLDMDTTGVLLVARTVAAYQALGEAFTARRLDKRYLAIVYGAPRPPQGRIDRAIGRHPTRRREMTVRRDGRPAITEYRRLGSAAGISLLQLGLTTGRTHQIRVHLKSLGHPLVGDPLYGEARWKALPPIVRRPLRTFPRPALHAWRITLRHPVSGEQVAFEAPPPDDLSALWIAVTGTPPPYDKPSANS